MRLHQKFLSALAVAACMIAAPMSASALTAMADGDTNGILDDDTFIFVASPLTGSADNPANGILVFEFHFTHTAPPNATAFATQVLLDGVNGGTTTGGLVQWIESSTLGGIENILASVALPNDTVVDLNSVLPPDQTLRISFTGATGAPQLTVSVSGEETAVPLPAPILLFGTALAGLGILSRRRSMKSAA